MSEMVKKTKKLIQAALRKKSNKRILKSNVLGGDTVPIIAANLREACSHHDAVNRSSVVQMISGREIDGIWCTHWSPLYCYWQHFDCDGIHITWQTNDGVRDGRGIGYTENNNTRHFNWISDEGKGCGNVGTANAVSCAKTMLCGTVLETFDSLQKGKNYVFATNNHIDATWCMTSNLNWILRVRFGRKKITEVAKIPMPGFEDETNDNNGLQ